MSKTARAFRTQASTTIMLINRIDVCVFFILVVATIFLEFYGNPREQVINLNDVALRQPLLPDIVSVNVVLVLTFIVPSFVYAAMHITRPAAGALAVFMSGLLESNILTMLVTNVFKVLVGRPRPFFATVCKTYEPADSSHCTGAAAIVREARKSFPSGHTSLSFSAGVFLSLSVARHVGLLDPRVSPSKSSPKLLNAVLSSLPVFVAGLVGASRIIDYHHHYSDVVAGALVGSFYALLIFTAHGGFVVVRGPEISQDLDMPAAIAETSDEQV